MILEWRDQYKDPSITKTMYKWTIQNPTVDNTPRYPCVFTNSRLHIIHRTYICSKICTRPLGPGASNSFSIQSNHLLHVRHKSPLDRRFCIKIPSSNFNQSRHFGCLESLDQCQVGICIMTQNFPLNVIIESQFLASKSSTWGLPEPRWEQSNNYSASGFFSHLYLAKIRVSLSNQALKREISKNIIFPRPN